MFTHGTASPSIGLFAEFAGAVVASLPRDLDVAAMQRWVELAGRLDLRERLRRAFVEPTPTARLVKTLTVTCHGNATASQLIKNGKYNGVNNLITDERFPIQPHDPIACELELFQFDLNPTWDEVLTERNRRNLDEPTYEQGLYLGIEHPEEQRKYPIVVTHKPVRVPYANPGVLVLDSDAAERYLSLVDCGRRWHHSFVFAGLRKVARS